MFKCQVCGTTVAAKTPAIRITLELREKIYPSRKHIHPNTSQDSQRSTLKARKEWRDDPGGWGYEIVREALVCAECAAKHHPLEGKSIYHKAV